MATRRRSWGKCLVSSGRDEVTLAVECRSGLFTLRTADSSNRDNAPPYWSSQVTSPRVALAHAEMHASRASPSLRGRGTQRALRGWPGTSGWLNHFLLQTLRHIRSVCHGSVSGGEQWWFLIAEEKISCADETSCLRGIQKSSRHPRCAQPMLDAATQSGDNVLHSFSQLTWGVIFLRESFECSSENN